MVSLPSGENVSVSAKEIAAVIQQLLDVSPALIATIRELRPLATLLPAPFNLIASPAVIAAIDMYPTLLPILQNIEKALENL
jgi:hypothetical protein